jgi:ribosome-associated translation inhibitor RaiA
MFAEDHENDLYASIDLVTKKVQQQLGKRHNKIIKKHHSEAANS